MFQINKPYFVLALTREQNKKKYIKCESNKEQKSFIKTFCGLVFFSNKKHAMFFETTSTMAETACKFNGKFI